MKKYVGLLLMGLMGASPAIADTVKVGYMTTLSGGAGAACALRQPAGRQLPAAGRLPTPAAGQATDHGRQLADRKSELSLN